MEHCCLTVILLTIWELKEATQTWTGLCRGTQRIRNFQRKRCMGLLSTYFKIKSTAFRQGLKVSIHVKELKVKLQILSNVVRTKASSNFASRALQQDHCPDKVLSLAWDKSMAGAVKPISTDHVKKSSEIIKCLRRKYFLHWSVSLKMLLPRKLPLKCLNNNIWFVRGQERSISRAIAMW